MKQYKPLIFFLLRFFGSYILLILLYNWYLNNYLPLGIPDPYTKFNADFCSKILNFFGFQSQTFVVEKENFVRLIVENRYTAIINEGCNAISILIIFVAFVLAFYTSFKQTFLYIFFSLIILFFMNIFRICLLAYIFRYMPEYSRSAHDYLFPAIIYGSIIILWGIWIKFFVFKKAKNEK